MDAFDFFPAATQTISINPPGGTGHPHVPSHPAPTPPPGGHLPPPVPSFPSARITLLHATNTGRITLWIVFALFAAGLLGVFVLSLRVERRAKVFHWLSAGVLAVAATSYMAMATGFGSTFVPIKNYGDDAATVRLLRQVFYARTLIAAIGPPLISR